MPFNTPVLFIIFNRPSLTREVFEAIRKAKPRKLYVAADGPRQGKNEEKVCDDTRATIKNIDWDCELKTLFRDENLGCGLGPKTAIDWFFDNEEEGIILEDDCVPSVSFFHYCDELLIHYKDDNRIMHINGNNFNVKKIRISEYSYHFISYPQAWGWASWKRAWIKYNNLFNKIDIEKLLSEENFDHLNWNKREYSTQFRRWSYTYNNQNDIWDYLWHLVVLINRGLVIVPKNNLISNIGFGKDATHTLDASSKFSNIKAREIDTPLIHPPFPYFDSYINNHFKKTIIGRSRIDYIIHKYLKLTNL